MRFLTAFLLCVVSSGCGTAFQTVMGWEDRETFVANRTAHVEVESELEGAAIQRRGADGVTRTLGRAPLRDLVNYPVAETYSTPEPKWPFWSGVAAEVIAYGTPTLFSATNDAGSITPIFATFLLGSLVTDVVGYLLLGTDGRQLHRSEPVSGGTSITYGAVAPDGRLVGEQIVRVPLEDRAKIFATSAVPASVNLSSVPRIRSERIVAIMEVEDGTGMHLEVDLVRNTTDQLRVTLTGRGLRTIDRGAQERMLLEQIKDLKRESYAACYDSSCQIELGQALAASHILRSKITRFGSSCVLMAELVDLKTEVTVGGASAAGDCLPESFAELARKVGSDLDAQ